MMEIGRKIAMLRKANKMSTRELAKETGFSQPFISQLENGVKNCTIDSLVLICKGLNIELKDFLDDKEIDLKKLEYLRVIKKAEKNGFSASALDKILDTMSSALKKE